jgi:transcriptional regulator with XRE-family HTH domain
MNQLARRIEMDQGLLSKIERGLRPPPEIVPHVQRIAEAFGFKKASKEYEELLEAAYRERFGKRKLGSPLKGAIVQFVLDAPQAAGGLSGYSPEPVAPDSAGQRPPAFDADDFFAHVDRIRQSRMLESAPDLPEVTRHLLESLGITTTPRMEQDETGISCDFRFANGQEFHLSIRPKNPAIQSAANASKQGDGR